MSFLDIAAGMSSGSGEESSSSSPEELPQDQQSEMEVESQNWVATIGIFGVFAALICKS